jgi:hypothetical protein
LSPCEVEKKKIKHKEKEFKNNKQKHRLEAIKTRKFDGDSSQKTDYKAL